MGLLGLPFTCKEAKLAETPLPGETPAGMALRLAKAKAGAVRALHPEALVIGCDTVVELAGEALGKPANFAGAIEMLTALAGRRHYVHTGVYLAGPEKSHGFTETTAVDFAPVPPAEIRAYAATPEPYDKAGGYGIQGWAARYIFRVEGCYYNVMGLPLAALYAALHTHFPL